MTSPPSSASSPTAATDSAASTGTLTVALVGNPNTGKTTLFNRLTGLRHKTSNFAGTTLEARSGRWTVPAAAPPTPPTPPTPAAASTDITLIDLPGAYSLELAQLESRVCREVLAGQMPGMPAPEAILVVLDATNLGRNLVLAGEALRRRLPTVVAVNMIDLARRSSLHIDASKLAERLGCPVVLISARSGEGLEAMARAVAHVGREGLVPTHTPPGGAGGDEAGLRAWAEDVYAYCASGGDDTIARRTDRADRVLCHPIAGLLVFAAVMTVLFASIFWLAGYPMGWIEGIFAWADGVAKGLLPEGLLRELLTDGVIAGVGATVVFLPQILLLFFLISLLEDTGYLSRAAFVLDRLLRPFGLPGHSFVPLLSSHACAIPGVIATRTIPDRRERLATILVAPFMTCSARLPVYVLLTGLITTSLHTAGKIEHPALVGAGLFIGCYALGILAGVLSALLARRTILRGAARPMALELPSYKLPSVRTALITCLDRGWMFIRKAGTAILAISVILWWLGAFPKTGPAPAADTLRQTATSVQSTDPTRAAALSAKADHLDARYAKEQSFLGRLGHAAEPIFAPIGADWQLSVGILASFAAREVFVGTMSVVIAGAEEGDDDAENLRIRDELAAAVRSDGTTKVFAPATCWALLVFYVLAMQCLPTLVVTAREAGGGGGGGSGVGGRMWRWLDGQSWSGWQWALLQLAWMSAVAYAAAWVTYQLAGGGG
jgi:ferrous iron transport protein B